MAWRSDLTTDIEEFRVCRVCRKRFCRIRTRPEQTASAWQVLSSIVFPVDSESDDSMRIEPTAVHARVTANKKVRLCETMPRNLECLDTVPAISRTETLRWLSRSKAAYFAPIQEPRAHGSHEGILRN